MFSIAAAAAARVLCPCPTVVAPAVATAVVVVVVVMVVVCRVGCCCCCAVVSVCSLLTLPRLFTDLSRGIAHLVAVIVVVWCEKLSASSLFALFLSSRSLARFASLRRCRHTVTTTHTQKKSQTEEREGGGFSHNYPYTPPTHPSTHDQTQTSHRRSLMIRENGGNPKTTTTNEEEEEKIAKSTHSSVGGCVYGINAVVVSLGLLVKPVSPAEAAARRCRWC